MGSRESRKDQFSRPRVPGVNRDIMALGDSLDRSIQVGEVKLGADSLGVKVQREGDQIDVSGTFSISEQASFDSVGTGHET